MKFYLLAAAATIVSVNGFAQRVPAEKLLHTSGATTTHINSTAKATGFGSTDTLSNIAAGSQLELYAAGTTPDSGYAIGMNAYGDMGWAERYDINSTDSSVQVTGIIATFGGTVSDTSTNTVNFRVWGVGPQEPSDLAGANYSNSGFPTGYIDSFFSAFNQLGIGTTKAFMFFTPSIPIASSFFVGYELNYDLFNMKGDTIGLYSSVNNARTLPVYVAVDSTDTLINNINVTEYADGSWHDDATDAYLLHIDLAIFPIVTIGQPTAVKNITRNGLTFFGNYPNPAVNSTNVQFALADATDVTIQVMDMSGHTLSTISNPSMSVGSHVVAIPTSDLAAGDYLYLVHTGNGDGVASKFTVLK